MKCPKCGYLGFDDADRCRNCGYEFSLAQTTARADLTMRFEEEDGEPLADLALAPSAPADKPAPAAARAVDDPDELPLFGGPITDGAPLITAPSPPRPPLAVRRATPEAPRLRTEYPRARSLDLSLDPQGSDDAGEPLDPASRANNSIWPDKPGHAQQPAAIAARFAAAIIDLTVLALVDVVVVYFTMQICGVGWADLNLLPKGPLIAFLLVQNGGYLIAFTAGGQTLGKMATGIRVVTAGSGSSLDVGRAVLRTLMWTLLLVPAGLGLLTAVFSRDRRGLHDRFAGTRVVRASA